MGSCREDAGDILPNKPAGAQSFSQPKILKGQVAALVCQSAPESRDTERLAGGSANKNVNWFILPCLDGGEIAVQRHVRVMVLQDRARKGVNLGQERRAPPERMPCDRCGLDAAANGTVDQDSIACRRATAAFCRDLTDLAPRAAALRLAAPPH